MARVASQICFHEKILLHLSESNLIHFDNILYLLTIFRTFLQYSVHFDSKNHATDVAIGWTFPGNTHRNPPNSLNQSAIDIEILRL